jgi:acyl carrier protein
MLDKEVVQKIILQSLRNLNDERDLGEQIAVSLGTRLFGIDADLDSLSLVSLIVDVEDAISNQAGLVISLTDDRAMSQINSPFNDVKALTEYIQLLLSEPV